MLWDVFCRVIDNFGDLGVCWRLSRDLASRGERVRLWVDDASALRWMAPETAHSGHPGIDVRAWPITGQAARRDGDEPAQVLVEAFGCEPPAQVLATASRTAPPVWVNLEYLSAEPYVERSHGLPSPMFHGPGAGLTKRFFYPGFTDRTGGLLREPGLLSARDRAKTPDARRAWLASLGVAWEPGDRVVSLFCYDTAPVGAFLTALQSAQAARGVQGLVHVLLTPGPATERAQAWQPSPGGGSKPGSALRLHPLPALPQPEFDRLLWASDLNLVRGEDSAVRALWAAQPHLWQLYRQDDEAHAPKLEAFLDRWLHGWEPGLAASVRQLWRAWNDLDRLAASGFPGLEALWCDAGWAAWTRASRRAGERLAQDQGDLVTRLLNFVRGSG